MGKTFGLIAGIAAIATLAFAASASATTFCVPGFHAACPMGGGNVAQTNLETAMQTNASDGVPDRIVIAAGTLTDTDTFATSGTDDLEVVGAGRGTGAGATRLTSSLVGGNNFVVNLDQRAVTMRDLTIVIPASFTDDFGAGLQEVGGDTVQNVDIESRNVGSDGAKLSAGTSFHDGALYGAAGGSLDTGIGTTTPDSGSAEVVGATISDAAWGVLFDDGSVVLNLRRSRIVNAAPYGVLATTTGIGAVENTVIESTGGRALEANTFGPGTPILSARNVTMVRTGGSDPLAAVVATVNAGATGSVNDVVRDSIIRGFGSSYARSAPVSVSDGNALLAIRYSNFAPAGTSSGDGGLTLAGNVNADPLFAGPLDFHLQAGSPSIDSADPAPSPPVDVDFDGLSRPVDGDGDGVALRDQGAFEYHPTTVQPPTTKSKKKKKCKKKKKRKGKRAGAAKKKRKCKKRKKKSK